MTDASARLVAVALELAEAQEPTASHALRRGLARRLLAVAARTLEPDEEKLVAVTNNQRVMKNVEGANR